MRDQPCPHPMATPAKTRKPRTRRSPSTSARGTSTSSRRISRPDVAAGLGGEELRAGKAQITEGYVLVKNGEAWLIGAHITPLRTTSTHVVADPTRTRKLLLHRRELDRLIGAVERKGHTIVPLKLYWKGGKVSSRSASPRQAGARQACHGKRPRLAAGEGAPAPGRR